MQIYKFLVDSLYIEIRFEEWVERLDLKQINLDFVEVRA